MSMVAEEGGKRRLCVICERVIPEDARICAYCGHDFRSEAEIERAAPKENPLPAIGGALVMVAGLLAIGSGVATIGGWYTGYGFSGSEGALRVIASVALISSGVIAVVGGMNGFTRRSFALAIVGGVASLWPMGLIVGYTASLFYGSELGLLGTVFFALSMNEFKA